jgi:serine/threonine-protein kinase
MKLKLNNYRVIKKIGHGGMGLVYVAEDLALGRLVALKVLAPYLVQDPEILERFRFEARNQAQLVHANITMVYSFLVEDEQAFLVLEFIDGETLESRINREGRIVATEALPIFRKILGALGYAHSKGVIHRDIKPGNIAFTSEGNVKIMDFGIALNIEETGRLTRTGHVLGTPHYMAPEQILGKELTFRTDIYALGITLFEMLTGRLPFDSKSDFEVRVAQINHSPPSPRSFGYHDITPELEEVILKALAKEPEARFSSAGEFLQALEAAVGRDHLVTVIKDLRPDKSTQVEKAPRKRVKPAPPPAEPEIEEPAPVAPPAEVQEISDAPPREELPTPPAFEAEPEAPPAPPPDAQIEEPSVPPPEASLPGLIAENQEAFVPPSVEEMRGLAVTPLADLPEEAPVTPPFVQPEREAAPLPPPAEVQEISDAPPREEFPTPPAFEAEPEAPPALPPDAQIEEPSVPPPEASLPGLIAENQEAVVPPSVEEMRDLAVTPLADLPEEAPVTPLFVQPEREATPAPPPAEVLEISGAPPREELPALPAFEAEPEAPPAPPPDAQIEEFAPPSPPQGALEAASAPALAEPKLEAPAVPPPSEPEPEAPQPFAPPFSERPSIQEPTTHAVPEEARIAPAVQAGWFSRPRLIFLPLGLLSVLALVIFFRGSFSLGPSPASKVLAPPQPGATPQESGAPPAPQPEKKPQVALPLPVSPVPKEAPPAKSSEMATEHPDKEKPMTLAVLAPPEKKAETPKAKSPQPDELRKAIKDNLAANGFSDLEVQADEGKGVVISGNVKNAGQKNKIMQIINAMGLAVPTDYGKLKVMKEAVAKTVKPKRPEAPSTSRQILEAAPKPTLPEAPRKPLPPRLDRGGREAVAETVREKVQAPPKPLPPRIDRGNIQF